MASRGYWLVLKTIDTFKMISLYSKVGHESEASEASEVSEGGLDYGQGV